MPLPDRLQPAKVNRQKLQQLADMAEEILSQIDNGAKEEDAGLKMLIDSWNSRKRQVTAACDSSPGIASLELRLI
ncbi:hypothetical protein AB8R05_01255 [Klebsiella variicola]